MQLKFFLVSSFIIMGFMSGCSSKQENIEVQAPPVEQEVVDVETIEAVEDFNNINTIADNRLDEIKSQGFGTGETETTIDEVAIDTPTPPTEQLNPQITTLQSIYFGFDVFNLNQQNQTISLSNAGLIKNIASQVGNVKLKVEGNCDEWGTDEYNYALGLKRAEAVKKDLVLNGVNSSNIVTVSYGESNPVCTQKSKECWQRNRRVDHKLLP